MSKESFHPIPHWVVSITQDKGVIMPRFSLLSHYDWDIDGDEDMGMEESMEILRPPDVGSNVNDSWTDTLAHVPREIDWTANDQWLDAVGCGGVARDEPFYKLYNSAVLKKDDSPG